MEGSRDQFFSRAGLATDQHGCVGSRDRLHLAQNASQGSAHADDLLEIVLGPNLFFEVELFLRQLVSQIYDLCKAEGILHGNGYLIGDRFEEISIRLGKYTFAPARDDE